MSVKMEQTGNVEKELMTYGRPTMELLQML
jgi:hypothetical protein